MNQSTFLQAGANMAPAEHAESSESGATSRDREADRRFETGEAGAKPAEAMDDAASRRQQLAGQWQQDLQTMLAHEAANAGPQPDTAEALKHLMQHDPEQYARFIAGQSLALMQEQAQTSAMIEEYRQQYPDLVPFEAYIVQDAAAIAQKAQAEGRAINDQQAVSEAIQLFRAKLGSTAKHQPQPPQGREAMRLDIKGGGQPASKPLDAERIWSMSPEEFHAFDQQIKRTLYGY